MEQEKSVINAENDVTFDAYSGNVYHCIDYKTNTFSMYVGKPRDDVVLDIDSYQKFGIQEERGGCGYYHLHDLETGVMLRRIKVGMPSKFSSEIYKHASLMNQIKWQFYDRKFHGKGLSVNELRKFESLFRKCWEAQRNRDEVKRQKEIEHYKKVCAEREAQEKVRIDAIDEMMKR